MPQLCAFPGELLAGRFGEPVTVIAGADSDYVPDHDGSSFRPMFTDVEIDVIAGAGHWVHADQPAAFVGAVRRALRDERTAQAH